MADGGDGVACCCAWFIRSAIRGLSCVVESFDLVEESGFASVVKAEEENRVFLFGRIVQVEGSE